MPGTKIIDKHPNKEGRRRELYTLFGDTDLLVTGLRDSGNGEVYYAITHENQLDNFLSDATKEKFESQNFSIVNPPEFNALKSIIIKNLDKQIEAYNLDEIKDNIEKNNDNIIIETVITLPTPTKMLKVKLQNQFMAIKATLNGLMIFNQYLPPASIEREVYIKLTPCYNCFAYNHHTKKCPRPKLTLCTRCGADTHIQQQCNVNLLKCINCKKSHHTLAPVCEVRKALIKERSLEERRKRRERAQVLRNESSKQTQSHQTSSRGGPSTPPQQDIPSIPPISTDLITKILSSIIFATFQNALYPGTYQQNIKTMYELNHLSPVNFPTNIESSAILNLTNTALQTNIPDVQAQAQTSSNSIIFPSTSQEEMNITPLGVQERTLSQTLEEQQQLDEEDGADGAYGVESEVDELEDINQQETLYELESQPPKITEEMRELIKMEPIIYYPERWVEDNKGVQPPKFYLTIKAIKNKHPDTIVTSRNFKVDPTNIIPLMNNLMSKNELVFERVTTSPQPDSFLVGKRRFMEQQQKEREAQISAQAESHKKTRKQKKPHRKQ